MTEENNSSQQQGIPKQSPEKLPETFQKQMRLWANDSAPQTLSDERKNTLNQTITQHFSNINQHHSPKNKTSKQSTSFSQVSFKISAITAAAAVLLGTIALAGYLIMNSMASQQLPNTGDRTPESPYSTAQSKMIEEELHFMTVQPPSDGQQPNVLQAFSLAKRLQMDEPVTDMNWDMNHDQLIDRDDVDWLMTYSVQLNFKTASINLELYAETLVSLEQDHQVNWLLPLPEKHPQREAL